MARSRRRGAGIFEERAKTRRAELKDIEARRATQRNKRVLLDKWASEGAEVRSTTPTMEDESMTPTSPPAMPETPPPRGSSRRRRAGRRTRRRFSRKA